jgi:hypothetical protein
MRVWNWLKTVPALAIIGAVLFMVLAVGGGLLLYGAHFANNMVHDQLNEQKISFPAKGTPSFDAKTYPGLQKYAGQAVDNGAKAKAFAEQYIKVHLKEVDNGRTYSQESTLARANPSDQKLAENVQTLFRGETLRGLLLYAWGWSVVAAIAFWAGLAAWAGALIVAAALMIGFVMHERSIHKAVATMTAATSAPVSVG